MQIGDARLVLDHARLGDQPVEPHVHPLHISALRMRSRVVAPVTLARELHSQVGDLAADGGEAHQSVLGLSRRHCEAVECCRVRCVKARDKRESWMQKRVARVVLRTCCGGSLAVSLSFRFSQLMPPSATPAAQPSNPAARLWRPRGPHPRRGGRPHGILAALFARAGVPPPRPAP